MRKNIWLIFGVIIGLPISIFAQISMGEDNDSILRVGNNFIVADTSSILDSSLQPFHYKSFSPNPTKSMLYSAVFPGLGQSYNRKYWKLPVIYSGFLGCIYAITWNDIQYTGYKNAYRDFTNDSKSESWKTYKPSEWSDDNQSWDYSRKVWFESRLKNGRNFYRRYRDLSCIVIVALYALCIIDAYVDAQLFDFDISEDLSFKMNPVFLDKMNNTSRTFGLQCHISL